MPTSPRAKKKKEARERRQPLSARLQDYRDDTSLREKLDRRVYDTQADRRHVRRERRKSPPRLGGESPRRSEFRSELLREHEAFVYRVPCDSPRARPPSINPAPPREGRDWVQNAVGRARGNIARDPDEFKFGPAAVRHRRKEAELGGNLRFGRSTDRERLVGAAAAAQAPSPRWHDTSHARDNTRTALDFVPFAHSRTDENKWADQAMLQRHRAPFVEPRLTKEISLRHRDPSLEVGASAAIRRQQRHRMYSYLSPRALAAEPMPETAPMAMEEMQTARLLLSTGLSIYR